MPPLANGLRNDLENVVKKARVIAERGAKSALEALTVHEAKSGGHLDAAGRELRARLRAHAKQLGDLRKPNGEQSIGRLIRECAYEHWHRMLFARFLTENDLLIHPEHNVSVSLDDVQELAREHRIDQWELASRFAQRMLPQIFRPDDPVLAVALPRERTLELEQLLESLPAETFKADDSLGWVYQFWQAEEKDRVNALGEKITGETLPAVTQLFTEHYMVLFLLHNTIGAWWAGKKLGDEATKRRSDAAKSEDEVRSLVNLPDYPFEYLRFVREPREGDEDGKSAGLWRPAAGAFDGWPREAKDLKVLDPCCGSGHFLVAAFDLLVRLRMAEEGLSLEDAIRSVLADNLFGLELDARCTQIAAFNLALAAWRMVGRPIDLPAMNIACCGLGPHASEDDWLQLAEQSGVAMPTIGREPIKNGLLNLHRLFSQAATLGSLINPAELPADIFVADYETLHPYLVAAMSAETSDEEARERAVAAQGMAKAAELLAGDYTLVITNVPYLQSGDQATGMSDRLKASFGDGWPNLATAFLERMTKFVGRRGSVAAVTMQDWLFKDKYQRFRRYYLENFEWDVLARLGPGAFETISGEVVNVCLLTVSRAAPNVRHICMTIDVQTVRSAGGKSDGLKIQAPRPLHQVVQLRNPRSVVVTADQGSHELLEASASFHNGICTGDRLRFVHLFWEVGSLGANWSFQQSTVQATEQYGGREQIFLWEGGNGRFRQFVVERLGESMVGSWIRGGNAWGRRGVLVSAMGELFVTLYTGQLFDENTVAVIPNDESDLPAIWAFMSSSEYAPEVRKVDKSLKVRGPLVRIPFDETRWAKVAGGAFPGGLPEPESNCPTQWVFHGWPAASTAPLQVAVARMLDYRWPAELDEKMRLSTRARELVQRCAELAPFADGDGIVCIPPVRGERPAADRLVALLDACGIGPNRDLDAWLREEYFAEHCKLFHDRPFIWHIWDGRKDGFHALVNYHKLAGPGDAGRRLLTALTHSYLGDWIRDQKDQIGDGKPGAEARLTAALDLKAELEKILAGEPPYDIFVRWKPLREQPIGWEPDIDDGVRLNIRPFLMAKDVGRKGAGVLRFKPNIKWDKDRGKEPQSLRPKADFPWFWGCDPEIHPAHQTNFAGGTEFDGNRWNDLHYTTAFKQAARDA